MPDLKHYGKTYSRYCSFILVKISINLLEYIRDKEGLIFLIGLDLVELGDSVLRAQRNPRSVNRHQLQSSQGSILEMDAETPSKDSLGSVGCFPPPTYESIYGKEETDMPPSYSDILLHRYIITGRNICMN